MSEVERLQEQLRIAVEALGVVKEGLRQGVLKDCLFVHNGEPLLLSAFVPSALQQIAALKGE